jgi:hypothetical protein
MKTNTDNTAEKERAKRTSIRTKTSLVQCVFFFRGEENFESQTFVFRAMRKTRKTFSAGENV